MTHVPTPGTPQQQPVPQHGEQTYVVAVAPGDKLYDLLRRDRDTALAKVEALEHEVAQLRSGASNVDASANPVTSAPLEQHLAEMQQLREKNAHLVHENETLKSRLNGNDSTTAGLASKLEAEQKRATELQAALDEAREALETTSAWGHELHAEAGRLRGQRGIAYKAVSRYRWEKEKRADSPEAESPAP